MLEENCEGVWNGFAFASWVLKPGLETQIGIYDNTYSRGYIGLQTPLLTSSISGLQREKSGFLWLFRRELFFKWGCFNSSNSCQGSANPLRQSKILEPLRVLNSRLAQHPWCMNFIKIRTLSKAPDIVFFLKSREIPRSRREACYYAELHIYSAFSNFTLDGRSHSTENTYLLQNEKRNCSNSDLARFTG
jgi:hypothetical protein